MNKELNAANDLIQLELELNTIKYKNIQIGSLLAYQFGHIYKDMYQARIITKLGIIAKMFFQNVLLNKNKPIDSTIKLFYYKTGDSAHHNLLSKSLQENNPYKIGTSGNSKINAKNDIGISLFHLIKLILFIINQKGKIKTILNNHLLTKPYNNNLLIDLLIQLIKSGYWQRFLIKTPTIKFIAGDFDRGLHSSPFFSAGKSLKISSFTLQHGVINPPYGYAPLIADKIFVWGDMTKQQLTEMGVSKKNIIITGTPIINIEPIVPIEKVLSKYRLPNKRYVILAINPIKRVYNEKLIELFKQIKIKSCDFNFYVKLHPAQDLEDFFWIINNYGIPILPKEITFPELLSISEIILTHNSGIVNEAFYNHKKIGIMDILPISAGNGSELNKYLNIPFVNNTDDFSKLIDLEFNELFQLKDSFCKHSGQDAIKLIQDKISNFI